VASTLAEEALGAAAWRGPGAASLCTSSRRGLIVLRQDQQDVGKNHSAANRGEENCVVCIVIEVLYCKKCGGKYVGILA